LAAVHSFFTYGSRYGSSPKFHETRDKLAQCRSGVIKYLGCVVFCRPGWLESGQERAMAQLPGVSVASRSDAYRLASYARRSGGRCR
jgi:hypothetical protein